MGDAIRELQIAIQGYPDSDTEELAELTGRLRRELLEHDVEDVARTPGTPPEGARGDALAWAELIVTTAGAVPPLLETIRGWSRRHRGCELNVELDGDRVSIPGGPLSDEQQRALDAWLRKHDH